MKHSAAAIILALFAVIQANADPPTRVVSTGQQANRDNEKLTILQNEYHEQRQLAAQLQQQRAVDLQGSNTEALAKTEARLEEVNGNMTQLQQEINLAQGQPAVIKPVAVRLTPARATEETKTTQRETETTPDPTGQWWDLYNPKRKK